MQCSQSEVKATVGADMLSAKWGQAGRDGFCYTIQLRTVFLAYVLTVWIPCF